MDMVITDLTETSVPVPVIYRRMHAFKNLCGAVFEYVSAHTYMDTK